MTSQRAGLSGAIWQTSSYSGSNGGQCVEVARNLPGLVAVRDSKDPAGPVLTFGAAHWAAFTHRVSSLLSGSLAAESDVPGDGGLRSRWRWRSRGRGVRRTRADDAPGSGSPAPSPGHVDLARDNTPA
jgi:hypothetical protein